MRLAKTFLSLTLSGIALVKGLTAAASIGKVRSWGRGNATIEASMVEDGTPISIGVETLFLLKSTRTLVITLEGVKSTWPLTGEVRMT